MERINNFNKFSKIYENEEFGGSSEGVIELAKKEMPLAEVVDDAVELCDPNNSNIQTKMMAAAEQTAQAQPAQSQSKVDVFTENYSGSDLMNPASMDLIKKSVIARLAPLLPGSQVRVHRAFERGGLANVPSGAKYVAQEFVQSSSLRGLDKLNSENKYLKNSVLYKDISGNKYDDVTVDYNPTDEELEHLYKIFEDLAKKSKWLNFINKATNIGGKVLTAVGFGLLIFALAQAPAFDGSGKAQYMNWHWDEMPQTTQVGSITGVGILGVGIAGLASTNMTDDNKAQFEASVKNLASVLKASVEPINMKITDLKTAADLHAVITSNMAEVSGNVTKTTYKTESVSIKNIKGFNKFKY